MPTDDCGRKLRTEFLGVVFDQVEAEEVLESLAQTTPETPYAYLVTPNVDHIVRLARRKQPADAMLADVYARADWCVCDSRVLSRLARLRDVRLPVVTGSDLTERLLETVIRPGDVVSIVGGTWKSAERLRERYPGVRVTQHIPPMGLVANADAMAEAAAFTAKSRARFTLLAVGAPQQELIAFAAAAFPNARGVALCIGASIDFLTGDQRRAPHWVRRLGFEWAHRLASEPRRLWRRYLVEGPRIFFMVARWRRSSSTRVGEDR